MIAAAESRAAELDRAMAIAVVDESGVPKAFSRMDGAPLAVKIAQDKAYTAAGFGLSTDAWFDFIKDDAPLAMARRPASSGSSSSAAAIRSRAAMP